MLRTEHSFYSTHMVRNSSKLTRQPYDVLVIGGGIHGGFVAWDAALRGLRVALIERDDFGSATSANSLKTVHGGLRYLQDGDLGLVRKMIRERKAYLKIAPHLVHPLPCLMPTYKELKKNKLLLTPGLIINDLIGFDRNMGQDEASRLPNSKPVSKSELFAKLPGLKPDGVTGGVHWHDGQVYNSERLLLSVLQSAVNQGADIVNYCAANQLIYADKDGKQVVGALAEDRLTGRRLNIKARVVVNATGAWTDKLVGVSTKSRFNLSTAVNLVVRRFVDGYGAGIFGQYQPSPAKPEKKSRLLFISPWRNFSIIGTLHEFYDGDPAAHRVTPETVQSLLDEVNEAYPGAKLTMEDVKFIHRGFLPCEDDRTGDVKLVRKGQVHDHAVEDNVEGLVSVVGVKYTTAREVAERAIDMVGLKLGKSLPKSKTANTAVHGAEFDTLADLLKEAKTRFKVGLSTAELESLVYNYGINYEDVLSLMEQDSQTGDLTPTEKMISAQIRYALANEMAIKLSDIVLRRTELGSAGYPGDDVVALCAKAMATELGWDIDKTQGEIEELQSIYNLKSMAE